MVFDERKKINQFCKKNLKVIAHQMEKQLELLIRGEQEHMKQEMSDFEREELTHKYAGVKRRIMANISLINDIWCTLVFGGSCFPYSAKIVLHSFLIGYLYWFARKMLWQKAEQI